MEKVTVEKVYFDDQKTQYGMKKKTSIYTTEYPGLKMSCLDKAEMPIKEGEVIEITIDKNGQFTNFKMGTGEKKPYNGAGRTTFGSDVESRLTALEAAVLGADKKTEAVIEAGDDEAVF